MSTRVDPVRLCEISSCLSQEIYRPLDSLQAGLSRLLEDPAHPPSEAERNHAQTMLTLCEDLRRLTRECLGGSSEADSTDEARAIGGRPI